MAGVLQQLADAYRRGSRAEAPVDLYPTGRGLRGAGSGMGGSVSKTAALSVVDWQSTIYAIVEAQATAQKRIVWRLFRTAKSGLKEDREPVTKHPALAVWHKPNRFYTGASLRETMANHKELTGETWLIVGRNRGVITELWPMRPDRMFMVPDPREFCRGYLYAPSGSLHDAVALELDEVVMDMRRHPLDPYRGMSPLTAAMLSARADREAERYNAEFFANDASPGGLLKLPGQLSTPQWEEQVRRWDEQHRGAGNRHKVHVMDNMKDADYVPMTYTRKDMQFVDLHRVSVEGFMRAYRISDFVLGMLRDVNRAAAEAAMVWFGITHVIPRADDTKELLNQRFLPLFGPGLSEGYEWDYDDVIPPDRVQAAAEATSNLDNALKAIAGGVPHDEAFQYYGLPAWELEQPEPVAVLPGPGPDDGAAAEPAAAGGRRVARPGARRRRRVSVRL